MNHCASCKWFPAGAKESRCALLGTQGSMKHDANGSNTAARALSGHAYFWTEADFGCVKHEKREKPR